MIKIDNLHKQYGSINALNGIDLHVKPGELFAYLGPNGAGKTTTIRILTGLTKLTQGTVAINGHDIQASPKEAKRQCGLVPQHVNLDSELSVWENLDIHGRLFSMPRSLRKKRARELLGYVELEDRMHSLVKQLSGGMKRRVMIARALMHEPKVLFQDEPTAGLDASIRRRIWALIRKVQSEGATVFLTTHYIEEAEFLADRVAFLDQGEIVALDEPAALMESQGKWALDSLDDTGMTTRYFPDRIRAEKAVGGTSQAMTLRRVNLEDAFLARTGKKVA